MATIHEEKIKKASCLDIRDVVSKVLENHIGLVSEPQTEGLRGGTMLEIMRTDAHEAEINKAPAYQQFTNHPQQYKIYEKKSGSAEDLLSKAIDLWDNETVDAALDTLKEAIRLKSDYVEAYVQLAIYYRALRDARASDEFLSKAMQLRPDYAEVYNIMGEGLMERGIYENAINAYNKALELEPNHPFANGNKGFALYLLKRLEEANKFYDLQMKISPKDFTVYIKKGNLCKDQKMIKEALSYFDLANELLNKGKLQGYTFRLGNFKMCLNQLEKELTSGLKTLSSLSIAQAINTNSETLQADAQALAGAKEDLILKFMGAFNIPQNEPIQKIIAQLQKDVEELKRRNEKLEEKVAEIQADMLSAGVRDLAMIKRGFKDLESRDPELLAYCKTFYWTTVNLFGAYRVASTGLLQKNTNFGEPVNDKAVVDGVRKATILVADIAQGVPLFGGVLGMLDKLIGNIYDEANQTRYDNNANAINKIIQAKIGTEDDISINVSKLALVITRAKEQLILYPETTEVPTKLQEGFKWIERQINQIKDKVIPSVDLIEKTSPGAQLGLQDATLFMAYLCKNYETVIKRKDSLEKQLETIIKYNALDQMVEQKSSLQKDIETVLNADSIFPGGCCEMF